MNERTKTIVVAMAIGAAFGAVIGWTASSDVDYLDGERHGIANLKPKDYLALGMSMLTLARQFGEMLR